MIRFLKGLVLLPVAIVVVALAVANRAPVRLSFDPFSADLPVFSVTLPLYVILFAAVALGVILGGIATWTGQATTRRPWPRASRRPARPPMRRWTCPAPWAHTIASSLGAT